MSMRIVGASPSSIRVAVVGSGPSAFYFCKYLLKENKSVSIDMIEKCRLPFGLVRYGVAPDHPEVKSCMEDFRAVMKEHLSRMRYFGNCEVGRDIEPKTLESYYDAIVYAFGAQSDKKLNFAHESELQQRGQVLGAREFVGWYNGHPDFEHLQPNLTAVKNVAIIGHGNVAIDCARILVKKVEELEETTIAKHALDVLKNSSVQKVVIVGRRGHPQAAFTMKELRELTKLEDVGCLVRNAELNAAMTEASKKEIESQRATKRMNQLLKETADKYTDSLTKPKSIELRFLSRPLQFERNAQGNLIGLKVQKTRLQGPPGAQQDVPTEEFEVIPSEIVIRSIGYKSVPLVPDPDFDTQKNVLKNIAGKVKNGVYCTGWLKRGPTGIIGTNINDARETVDTLLHDVKEGIIPGGKSGEKPSPLLKLKTTSWDAIADL